MSDMQLIAAILFGLALAHTFAAKSFERLADRYPRHAGLFHFFGEVEVVFGLWALILIVAMAFMVGGKEAIAYAESRTYTEPLFVFVIMVVAASKPVLEAIRAVIATLARLVPLRTPVVNVWLCLALVPLIGSLITEPAAMTLAALMLAPQIFRKDMPEWLKYAALGVLFVNVSIGGTLTSFAAPPVLMVASAWNWDSAFMASTFGWRAAIAVLINATVVTVMLRKHIVDAPAPAPGALKVPLLVSAIHLAFLAAVVGFAHHPVIFMGLFMFFIGFTHAYEKYQNPLILKEGLLVGFFLAGLVVLGGMQQWWLQPIVSSLGPTALFFGATFLTAITDNAALTYLGSLIVGLSDQAKYMLVAGAVAGGGLTIIANAPNPAGAALVRDGFEDESIGVAGLLAGALPPTIMAMIMFLL
ncbi:putative Na+/H+ antiporter [Massilia pseudoviolaceinigra]|uniref:putative Na+/H+ antiporter n=1 Tax=Massilia pseudoviolaceinigra TaxID=3057165 RepID=UPI00279650AB|nr:putative Na+/H+ antiporter [Massilia sp. CCM 9206]MDQ1922327.1 putative Na+/H+ antiporter [Massilia sp. CCM 9206]